MERKTGADSVLKRVARLHRRAREASLKPFCPLRRASMREGFGVDVPRAHALQPIVSDGSRGSYRTLDIPRLEQMALIGGMGPYSGKTIRLQFDPHRDGFGRLRITLLRGPGFRLDSHQLLHRMSNFVG